MTDKEREIKKDIITGIRKALLLTDRIDDMVRVTSISSILRDQLWGLNDIISDLIIKEA